MSVGSGRFGRARAGIAAGLIAMLWGTAASAGAAEDCGTWTLFPAFNCEDHEARPADSFNPMGMPYLFEDPHNTTGLNFAYVWHGFPDDSAFQGGGVHVLALQIRLAITERISFIATKDGLAIFRPDNPIVPDDTGIFDMTFGFKGSLIDSREHDFILSPALRYEIPMGSYKQYQGYGDGVMIPSASFRWGLGELGLEGANIVGGLGAQLPIDRDANSDSIVYNLHLDYGFEVDDSVVRYVVPFVELNGIHYTRSGDGTNAIHTALGKLPVDTVQTALGTGRFEGVDVANLGSRGIAGGDLLILGGGIRLPTTWGISFGLMAEGPISKRQDIYGHRITFMTTWEL